MAEEKKIEKSLDPRHNHKGRLRKKKAVRARNVKRGADQEDDRGKKILAIADGQIGPSVEDIMTPKNKRNIKKDANDSPWTLDFEQPENAEMEIEKDEGVRKEKAFRRADSEEEKKVLEDMQIVSDEVDRIGRPLDTVDVASDMSAKRVKKKPATAARTVEGRRLRMS